MISHNIRGFINNIQNDCEVTSNLTNLKLAMNKLCLSEIYDLHDEFPLNFLFDCLNTCDKEQVSKTCEVLNIFFPAIPETQVLRIYGAFLFRALAHPTPEVRRTIMKLLIKFVDCGALSTIFSNPELVQYIFNCVCDKDTLVGTLTQDFLIKFGKTKLGLQSITQHSVVNGLIQRVGNENIYALRLIEVMIEISISSQELLNTLEKAGHLNWLLNFFKSSDTLSLLALLEITSKLAVTDFGYDYLCRHGVLKDLAHRLNDIDDPMLSISFPGFSRFFGHIGQMFPRKLLNDFPEILLCTFSAVDDSNDEIMLVAALELIGLIAYLPEGKLAIFDLDGQSDNMRHVMERMCFAITNLSNTLAVKALHALSNILNIETDQLRPEITKLTETWFNQLGTSALSNIVTIAKQPFPDLKMASYLVLLNMCNQRWAQQKFSHLENMMDFILDRNLDTDLEVLYMKYNILKIMLDSETAESVFNPIVFKSIEKYVRKGAIYVEPVVEVAIEGAE